MPSSSPNFRTLIRAVIRRGADAHGQSLESFAATLGVHRNALMLAAPKAEIGLDLVERLAREAGVSPLELAALELAWFRARAADANGKARSRGAAEVRVLLDFIADFESYLDEKGLREEFLARKGGGALVKQAKRKLKRQD